MEEEDGGGGGRPGSETMAAGGGSPRCGVPMPEEKLARLERFGENRAGVCDE